MDGVIVDSEQVYQEIERQMYDELGIPVSPEEQRMFMGTSERFMWQYLMEKYQIEPDMDVLVQKERLRFMAEINQPGRIPLMPGLMELLEDLAMYEIPSWVASSSSGEIIERVLLTNNIRHYFKGITSGDDVKNSKPAPDIFLKTALKAGMDPGKCLVIEDSENGVRAARSAGMKVIALLHQQSGDLNLKEADKIIHSLHEINTAFIRQLLLNPC